MAAQNYVVICRADNESEAEMVVATRRLFSAEQAAKYAGTIAPNRWARVLTASEYLLVLGWKKARDE